MNDPHLPAEVLAALAVILVVARLAGALARRLGQPAVIGEITAGLALGPSLLGLLPGDLPHVFFPTETRPVLNAIAQLGLVLFMFLIGLEADTSMVRGQARTAITVSISSIALPFALGVPLALVLAGDHPTTVPAGNLAFVLFIGASMSITAFPVLARILAERRMDRTPLGSLALATASLDDVIAWSLLAVVVAITASGSPVGALGVALGAVAYIAVLALAGRPLLARALRGTDAARLGSGTFALVLVAVLASSWVTDAIGVHLVFGAFALGVLFPPDPALREAVGRRIDSVTVLLLPVFFVVTGLGVDLTTLSVRNLGELGLILLVAVGGKVGGAFLAARSGGLDGRRSLALGLLANTRGLTELVILGIGRQLGVLDAQLYGLLVVMALVTTAMAGPLLDLVYPARLVDADLEIAQRAAAGALTVVTDLPAPGSTADAGAAWGSLLAVSQGLAASSARGHVLLSRVLPLPGELGAGSLALLAGEVDTVTRAGRAITAANVTAAPNVVRSGDPAGELARQADRVDAEFVVATSAAGLDGADAPADVVVVPAGAAPAASGAVVLAGSEPAAWEVAVRLARSGGRRLQVRAPGGVRQLVDAARRAGVDVEAPAGGPDEPVAFVVTGADGVRTADRVRTADGVRTAPAAPGAVTLAVLPGGPRRRHGLAERAARIPSGPVDLRPTDDLIEEPT